MARVPCDLACSQLLHGLALGFAVGSGTVNRRMKGLIFGRSEDLSRASSTSKDHGVVVMARQAGRVQCCQPAGVLSQDQNTGPKPTGSAGFVIGVSKTSTSASGIAKGIGGLESFIFWPVRASYVLRAMGGSIGSSGETIGRCRFRGS